jgi:hypothetical protein
MSTRKRAAPQTDSNPMIIDPSKPDYTCSAHGCPLRATIFDSVTGPPRHGRCRYHDRLAPRRWPALTEALNTNPLRQALMLFGLPYLAPDDPAAPRPRPRPPAKPIDVEVDEERIAIQAEGEAV